LDRIIRKLDVIKYANNNTENYGMPLLIIIPRSMYIEAEVGSK
jgi:hypothetical protein